jgi:hypothetical protein
MVFIKLLRAEKARGNCSLLFPPFAILLKGEMMVICNEHRYIHRRSVGVDIAAFVEQRIYCCTVGKDDYIAVSYFEGEDGAVLFCPFSEPEIN